MEFASAAAFLCITQHGAMPSMPKLEEVNVFLEKYLWKNILFNVKDYI